MKSGTKRIVFHATEEESKRQLINGQWRTNWTPIYCRVKVKAGLPESAYVDKVDSFYDDNRQIHGTITFKWDGTPRRGPMVTAYNRRRKWAGT